ncbi:MAG: hypothetical protein RMJ16_11505 [Thermoguttaceae bacterium]|nr:hypothetical protein [Thermoguttaceae bacterium]
MSRLGPLLHLLPLGYPGKADKLGKRLDFLHEFLLSFGRGQCFRRLIFQILPVAIWQIFQQIFVQIVNA